MLLYFLSHSRGHVEEVRQLKCDELLPARCLSLTFRSATTSADVRRLCGCRHGVKCSAGKSAKAESIGGQALLRRRSIKGGSSLCESHLPAVFKLHIEAALQNIRKMKNNHTDY